MARGDGGVRVDSTPRTDSGRFHGDHNPHVRNFLKHNDAHGTPVSASAASALHKMFNAADGNLMYIRADGQGKITTQFKDGQGNPIGHAAFYDINTLEPKDRKQFEYQAKRHIVSEHMGIPVEDLNNLKEVNGVYHSKDRDGNHLVIEPDNTEREAIDKDISSLGLDNNKQHIPDSVGKGVLDHAADHEAKSETDPVKQQALKDKINNGTVHSYEYDKKTDQYKFYIIQEGKDLVNGTGKADGNMMEVSIDRQDLPSQVKNALEYNERKVAAKNVLRLEGEIQDLKVINSELHFKGIDGTPGTRKPTDDQWKKIEAHLAAKGFDNNKQYISDSVGNAALKHAIDQETDPAKKAALEGATVYNYYDNKSGEHAYHVVKKDIKKDADGKIEEMKDADIEKVIFTDDKYKALLDTATLNAVRKFGKLADGTQITDDMDVDFPRNDKGNIVDRTKFVVEDAQGGKHTLTGDSGSTVEGENLGTAIKKELDVKPRANPDDIIADKTDPKDVKISTKGTDSELGLLEKEQAEYKKTSKRWVLFFSGLGEFNNIVLNLDNVVEEVTAKMVGAQDNPSAQQPAGAVLTDHAVKGINEKVNKHREKLQKKIDILKEHAGAGKGAAVGKMIESMKEQLEDINKAIKHSKIIDDETKARLLSKEDDKTGD